MNTSAEIQENSYILKLSNSFERMNRDLYFTYLIDHQIHSVRTMTLNELPRALVRNGLNKAGNVRVNVILRCVAVTIVAV
jgi:hypothetical protein